MDLWCLQEVWYADVQRELYAAVKDNFPYALSAINLTDYSDDDEVACNSTAELEACVTQSNCGELYNDTATATACVVLR